MQNHIIVLVIRIFDFDGKIVHRMIKFLATIIQTRHSSAIIFSSIISSNNIIIWLKVNMLAQQPIYMQKILFDCEYWEKNIGASRCFNKIFRHDNGESINFMIIIKTCATVFWLKIITDRFIKVYIVKYTIIVVYIFVSLGFRE